MEKENKKDELLFTQEGYDKLVAEREELSSVKLVEVAERLKEAISYGDISENSEYDSAKNEQAEINARIQELDNMIREGRIVKSEDADADVIYIGDKVEIKNIEENEIEKYTLVGANESDPFNGKITNDSAIGKAILGRKVGDKVMIEVPDGIFNYEILSIEK